MVMTYLAYGVKKRLVTGLSYEKMVMVGHDLPDRRTVGYRPVMCAFVFWIYYLPRTIHRKSLCS